MAAKLKYFQFKALLQKDKWLHPAYVGVDDEGTVKYLSSTAPLNLEKIEIIEGYAIPGFQNAHSHAFQYAMAGLAEKHAPGTKDDFWTWREAMYQCALSVDPDDAEAIATMLYAEMLRHGYTHVAEFHYLHHDKNGKRYQNLTEMGERMIAAAKTAGIKITLIPVFYQKGGFGKAPQERQRRFISKTLDDYLQLLDETAKLVSRYDHANLGYSIHSLRAVDPNDIIKAFELAPSDIPFHIHVAEQLKEVEDCLSVLKARPAEWLLENLPVSSRFNLVHATHLNDWELKRIATSGATVVLCPSTEGNLGDGFFNMKDYVSLGGKWCIGTDSHIGLNPLEEFRMIDYRQRLLTNTRNPFSNDGGGYMIDCALENGRNAMGRYSENYFDIDKPFDAVVFDANAPLLSITSLQNILSVIVYAADAGTPLGTIVNGNWVVRSLHQHGDKVRRAFKSTLEKLGNR
jgi:formimidoylglutamate deiminase